MLKFFGLAFLRPVGRFLANWISVSTAPSTFARERIRLGDSLNFFNAANFFVYAIFGAVFAEVTALHLLDIGDLTEAYYWLFIVLTSIPFVLLCFLLLRLVTPLCSRMFCISRFIPSVRAFSPARSLR
jgi:hypothetical protein